MGILDFLHKSLNDSPVGVWDRYTSSYSKKCDLAKEIIGLSEYFQRSHNPDLLQKIVDLASDIGKLIPDELVEVSMEEQDLDKVNKEYAQLEEIHTKALVINQIMKNHRDLVDNYNELLPHMKDALESLGRVLKQELAFIELIKKDASIHDNVKKLVALIYSNERILTDIFGNGVATEELFELLVITALTKSYIMLGGEIDKEVREFRFDYPKERRAIKNNLDNITTFLNQKLSELGENEFEVFYTQTDDGKSRPYHPLYGIFIRYKNNKRRAYIIREFNDTYLSRRIKKDKIISEYDLEYIARTTLRTGIDVLKTVNKQNQTYNPERN